MKKLLVVLVVFIGLVVGIMVAIGATLGKGIASGVTRVGPSLTGTKVQLADASLFPLTGGGALHGLVIGNPTGWSNHDLLSAGTIQVSVAPLSLLRGPIRIREVVITDAVFSYETKLLSSNLGDLLKNLEKVTGPGDPAAQPRKLIIDRFVLEGAKARVGAGPTAATVPLPRLELNDIGTREGGLSGAQLGLAVSREIIGDVLKATTRAVAALGGEAAAGALQGAGSSVRGAASGLGRLFGGGDQPAAEPAAPPATNP